MKHKQYIAIADKIKNINQPMALQCRYVSRKSETNTKKVCKRTMCKVILSYPLKKFFTHKRPHARLPNQ